MLHIVAIMHWHLFKSINQLRYKNRNYTSKWFKRWAISFRFIWCWNWRINWLFCCDCQSCWCCRFSYFDRINSIISILFWWRIIKDYALYIVYIASLYLPQKFVKQLVSHKIYQNAILWKDIQPFQIRKCQGSSLHFVS